MRRYLWKSRLPYRLGFDIRVTRIQPLASPVFRWNHDILMRQGGEGLARRLNARLVGIGSKASTHR